MFRALACILFMRALSAAALFLLVATTLHAQTATVWNYKGSVVALSQSGSNVIVAYQTLSDALIKSGAHVGDPLFRGQRVGNSLTGKVYRFFGSPCQPMGFGVEGSIRSYRDAVRHQREQMLRFIAAAIRHGVYFHDYGGAACHQGYCAAMTPADADEALERLDDAVRTM